MSFHPTSCHERSVCHKPSISTLKNTQRVKKALKLFSSSDVGVKGVGVLEDILTAAFFDLKKKIDGGGGGGGGLVFLDGGW